MTRFALETSVRAHPEVCFDQMVRGAFSSFIHDHRFEWEDGLVASFALTRVVKSFLVGVRATDVVTFVGVPAALLVVVAIASFVPARRASGIHPVEALPDD